jgi:hypothetical protein
MLKRETARLRAILRHALLASAATSSALGVYACSAGGETGGGNDASAADATGPQDASSEPSADGPAGDADTGGPVYPPGCTPPPPVALDAGGDVGVDCIYRVSLQCGLPSFVTSIYPPNCAMDLQTCEKFCTGAAFPFLSCEIANGVGCDDDAMAFVAADGEAIAVDCDKCSVMGRRPAGLVRARAVGRSPLGAFFGHAAHLEAASVEAFASLAGELKVLGAPAELILAAERSARDEERHARLTGRIARRHGGEPPLVRVHVRVARGRSRSLEAMAIENAVEGCVRETFGALTASWQAAHARDPRIARTMASIARDETRHAALAWAIARWVEPRLDAPTRRRVVAARRRAVRTLRRQATATVPEVLARRAGVPPATAVARMLDALQAALWRG